MEMKKEIQQEENIYTALVTAGVVLSMACLKHSSAAMSFIEQWRAWVFLVLHVVLLAIFFTSTPPTETEDESNKCSAVNSKIRGRRRIKRVSADCEKSERCQEIKNFVAKPKAKGKTKTKRVSPESEDAECCLFDKKKGDGERERERGNGNADREDDIEPGRLSNEELNQRVEAFITMFRQHLVLDARKGGDRVPSRPRQAEEAQKLQKSYYFSNMNISTQEVTCSV